MRPWKGGGVQVSNIPLIILKNTPYSKNKYGKYPQNSESIDPHIPKIDSSIQYPIEYLQKIPRIPLSFWPISMYPKNPSRASMVFITETSPCEIHPRFAPYI